MPQIIQRPADPMLRSFTDYITRLQQERYQREQERAQEREAQEQRLIAGVGVGLGAIGGLLLAPATVVAGAGTAGTVAAVGPPTAMASAAAAAATTAATLGSVATGAAVGGRMASQFGAGDIAGGVGTAAQAVRGVMQDQQDRKMFGAPVSDELRNSLYKEAADLGISPGDVEASGQLLLDLIHDVKLERADAKTQLKALQDVMPWATSETLGRFKEEGISVARAIHEGEARINRGKVAQAKKMAAAKSRGAAEAQVATAMKLNPGRYTESVPTKQIADRALNIKALNAAYDKGLLPLPQYIEQMDALTADPLQPVITDVSPAPHPTPQQLADKQLTVVDIKDKNGKVVATKIAEVDPATPRNPTPKVRIVDELKSAGDPNFGKPFGEWWKGLSPHMRETKMRNAWNRLIGTHALTQKGPPLPEDVQAAVRAQYKASREFVSEIETPDYTQSPQGAQKSQPAQQPTGGAPPQAPQAQQSFVGLAKTVAQKPIASWTPQEAEQGFAAIGQIMALDASGAAKLTIEQLVQLGKWEAEISARRNP